MSYFLFMLFPMVILVTIQYLLEVHIGSSTNMYDGESGVLSDCLPRKSTHSQFVGKLLPLQLTAMGFPLLIYDLLSGVILFLVSLLLFCRYRKKKSPARAQRSATT